MATPVAGSFVERLEVGGESRRFVSLPALERAGLGPIGRLPVSIRILLESVARNRDGRRVRDADVTALASWQPRRPRTTEVPFVVARVLLQDFTGVPALVDLAAMRGAAARLGRDPAVVRPLVPVDLVVDHSVQVDRWRAPDALALNRALEMERNAERYRFLRWGEQAFEGLRVVPPGIGICHQVNLEHLATGVVERDGLLSFDTLVGADSHTTMVNGIAVLGWGVGGIEAEAAMLGEPIQLLEPDVVGVRVAGKLRAGATATDVVLHVTELLRKTGVVGSFVEFHGEGVRELSAPSRATIANMAPEYGATCGFFPADEETLRYYAATGRPPGLVARLRAYLEAQGVFGIPRDDAIDYSRVVALDLAEVRPSVSGPRRPQDRVDLERAAERFRELFSAPAPAGYGRSREALARRFPLANGTSGATGGEAGAATVPDASGELTDRDTNPLTEIEMMNNRPVVRAAAQPRVSSVHDLGDGDIAIAAITSCTNTSNPSVMLAAGLVAKKALARGLRVAPHVKTSLAPGSRAVSEYLDRTGLLRPLEALGFELVAYGCTTCIGNSGPLDARIESAIAEHDLVVASVLSGNRNFEARIHQSIRANYLMSPPLVVAYAIAGRIDRDLVREPLGMDDWGAPIYLADIWPEPRELAELEARAAKPEVYRELYAPDALRVPGWRELEAPRGLLYPWDRASTYLREPPFFEEGAARWASGDLRGARALAVFGDSLTTDHVSPAGAIAPASPAALYLEAHGVPRARWNSYGSRRGNHEVMVRGTFANVRLRNLLAPGSEGSVAVHQPSGERLSIFDAAERYGREGVPLVIFGGRDYGSGSSRDWAAKGPRLLGVRAVIARSFERIHRSNLVGMGVLPCQLPEGTSAATLGLDGTETFDLSGIAPEIAPRKELRLVVRRADGKTQEVPVRLRIETPAEVEHVKRGGILPYVLAGLLAEGGARRAA